MTNFIFELLNCFVKSNAIRMALPFITVVIFFNALLLIIQRVKTTKLNILDISLATLATAAAYFGFIFSCGLGRIDYVFDIFRYLEGPLKETAVVIRGWSVFNSSTLSVLRIATFELYQARRRQGLLTRALKVSLYVKVHFISTSVRFELTRFINDFKEVFTYKTKSIHLENCILRC